MSRNYARSLPWSSGRTTRRLLAVLFPVVQEIASGNGVTSRQVAVFDAGVLDDAWVAATLGSSRKQFCGL